MDIFGIGPLELVFIVIIVLLVLGPKEMVSALRTIGKVLRGIVTSEWWSSTKQTIQDVRKLPYDLMREAGMEEDLRALDEIRSAAKTSTSTPPHRRSPGDQKSSLNAWTNPPPPTPTNTEEQTAEIDGVSGAVEPSILPPGSDFDGETSPLENQPETDQPQPGQNPEN